MNDENIKTENLENKNNEPSAPSQKRIFKRGMIKGSYIGSKYKFNYRRIFGEPKYLREAAAEEEEKKEENKTIEESGPEKK